MLLKLAIVFIQQNVIFNTNYFALGIFCFLNTIKKENTKLSLIKHVFFILQPLMSYKLCMNHVEDLVDLDLYSSNKKQGRLINEALTSM